MARAFAHRMLSEGLVKSALLDSSVFLIVVHANGEKISFFLSFESTSFF